MRQNESLREPVTLKRVLISGANGLIGRELSRALRTIGVSVTNLTRQQSEPDAIHWNPDGGNLSPDLVSGFDAVVHLAGEPVGDGRWTADKKRRIYRSRVEGTRILSEALASADIPPRVFVCASGINYYGSSASEVLDETAPAGSGFLSQVCVNWEQSASALSVSSRVVMLRIGVVLSKRGGTLAKMLPAFRLGLGGYVGSGETYLSWIALNDLVRAVLHILHSDHLRGPVNIVSPDPVTGRQFARELGTALDRPAWFRIPEFAVRLALGEFAEETILSSVRAVPAKLVDDGFRFLSPTIEQAFREVLATGTME